MRANPSPNAEPLAPENFARIFSHSPDSVAVAQFVSLWRRYPIVRTMAEEALKKPDPTRALQFFAAFGIGSAAGVVADFPARVRDFLPAARARVTFGGLSLVELIALMRRYKSGRRDPAAYLLLCHWKRELAQHAPGKEGALDPRLVELTLLAVRRSIAAGNSRFFRDLAAAMDAVQAAKEFTRNGRWDHNPADNEGDEWRYGLLLFMRTHPQPRYRMREFRGYLQDEFGLSPDAKTIRNFCRQNGIALDARAGAPRRRERLAGRGFPNGRENKD